MSILELSQVQIDALLPYANRLRGERGNGDDDSIVLPSHDAALTIDIAQELFPDCSTAHLWFLDDAFVVDIVNPDGTVDSVNISFP